MPEIPQIRAPGRMAVDFGEGVTRLGSALTQIATGLQQDPAAAARQQAGLDVGEYDQVASATRAANSWKNSLKANLAQNPDYDMAKYEEDWQALSSDLLAFATLPAAYVKVQEMLTKIRDETESFTMDTVALRQVAKDEALYLTNRDDFVQAGDVAGLTAEANYAFSKGIITEAEMAADLEQQLPKARYNSARSYLFGLGDYDTAIQMTMDGKFREDTDLSAEQAKDLQTELQNAKTLQLSADNSAKAERQSAIFTDFLRRSADTAVVIPRGELTEMMIATAGTDFYGQIKQYRDAVDAKAERVAQTQREVGRSVTYATLSDQMQDWNGTGKPPWDVDHLNSLLAEEKLNESEWDKLNDLYTKTQDDIRTGTRAGGPDFEDPGKIAELWAIVADDKLDPTEKYRKARPFFAKGVPPDRWNTIVGNIDELNNRVDWKQELSSIGAYYQGIIAAENVGSEERQRASLEYGEAVDAMMKVFRQYPGAPDKWAEARRSLLDPKIKAQLIKQMEEKLKARLPGFFGLGGMTQAMQLETISEQLPNEFAMAPGLVAQRGIASSAIRQEEEKILTDARVNIVDRYQDPTTGVWTYSTAAIVRDSDGKPTNIDALKKAGALYQVRSTTEGGKIKQIPGRLK